MIVKYKKGSGMNRIIVIVILVALNFQAYAQEKLILEKPTIDKKTELLSIVFRLAGRQEYTSKQFKLYTDRVEQHFEQHKNHELIQFTKSIMNERGLGYDAVAWMSVYLDEHLNIFANVKPLTEADSRWNNENIEKFVSLLQKFYKDVEFEKFFSDNADLYTETVNRFIPIYEQIDLNWYLNFYGKDPNEAFLIIIGVGNGSNNYGLSLDYSNGDKKIYAIVGVWKTDDTGMPVFDISSFLSLLHEFNHSFVNYLTEKNKDEFRENGEKIFSFVKNQMTNQAYIRWETMLNEALVRASVIKYMKDHKFEHSIINELIKREKENGFLWIEELVDELENYDRQRDKYPTLESYMPRLIEAYKIWSEKIQSIEDKRPEVISISEFTNGSMNVSPDIKTITINFDMPLSDNGYSVYLGTKGQNAFPKVEGINYVNNNQSVIMRVSLEKDKEYQFVLVGKNFTSVDGIGIKDYEVNFKTDKQ